MIFTKENRIVDHKIFAFKKKIRKNKLSIIHTSDNFERVKKEMQFFYQNLKMIFQQNIF